MVSSHGFSFKNGSAISVTNDDRTLQWLLDFDWLLTSCPFSLIYLARQILARKMRRNARESDFFYLFQACMHQKCVTQAIHINESLYDVSLLLQFIGTAIEKPGHWMKQQSLAR